MKSLFTKISAVIIVMFFFIAAKAQIVYTDVNPDSTIGNGPLSYNLDLNNDGIPDFTITDSIWSIDVNCQGITTIGDTSAWITPLGSNEVLSGANGYPYRLLPNYAIAPDSVTWSTTPNQTLFQNKYQCRTNGSRNFLFHLHLGNWADEGDGFIGLKLVKGGNTYYGWVRLSYGASTVIDYAYNSVADQPILAQEGATSFPEQGPPIAWQKSLGGSNDDEARSIQPTPDGGYIVAGYSNSIDGDVTGTNDSTNENYWVVKLSSTGTIQWQKSLGGSANEQAFSIQLTSDGGYIVAGRSNSSDGDVTVNHGNNGDDDYWVVKLSSTGSIQWQKSLGGSLYDQATSIQLTSDGGYIVVGNSQSNDGDVTGNHGDNDYWIVKLDGSGNIVWQKSLGGSLDDIAISVQPTPDGGYIVSGYSSSNDGDVSGNHGGYYDWWVVKLNSTGSIQWQKTLGGSGDDEATSIQPTPDGGYIVAGYTNSVDGDVTGNHGGYDGWIVKLNSTGSIQWKKCLGGSKDDIVASIQITLDGGYIVAGYSTSNEGDIRGNHGNNDYWVVKLNSTGSIQWQKSMGGSSDEYAYSILPTPDSGYVIAGSSNSNDYDVTGTNHGSNFDYWIVKLGLDITLPLRLLSFTGTLENNTTKLNWQTTNEINTADFIVERSANATNFLSIGKVQAQNTSASTNLYEFTDDAPLQGMNYYRLKMEDIDGKFTYSNIVAINFDKNYSLTISPVPAHDAVTIKGAENFTTVQFIDASGRIIKQFGKMPNNIFPVADLAKGVYYIRLMSRNNSQVLKMIKE